jgi:hypothetical protein
MAPSRVVLLATICAVIMLCAGAVQLLGIDRIVVTNGAAIAPPSLALVGDVDVNFKSDYFPLER